MTTRFGRVRGWLQNLADRDVELRFWFGRDDQGVAEFASWFGPQGRSLRGVDRLRTRLVEGTDHAMQSPRSRATFIGLLLDEVDELARRAGLGALAPSGVWGSAPALLTRRSRPQPGRHLTAAALAAE